jgi:hypothetical protein
VAEGSESARRSYCFGASAAIASGAEDYAAAELPGDCSGRDTRQRRASPRSHQALGALIVRSLSEPPGISAQFLEALSWRGPLIPSDLQAFRGDLRGGATACHAEGPGFESHQPLLKRPAFCRSFGSRSPVVRLLRAGSKPDPRFFGRVRFQSGIERERDPARPTSKTTVLVPEQQPVDAPPSSSRRLLVVHRSSDGLGHVDASLQAKGSGALALGLRRSSHPKATASGAVIIVRCPGALHRHCIQR